MTWKPWKHNKPQAVNIDGIIKELSTLRCSFEAMHDVLKAGIPYTEESYDLSYLNVKRFDEMASRGEISGFGIDKETDLRFLSTRLKFLEDNYKKVGG